MILHNGFFILRKTTIKSEIAPIAPKYPSPQLYLSEVPSTHQPEVEYALAVPTFSGFAQVLSGMLG